MGSSPITRSTFLYLKSPLIGNEKVGPLPNHHKLMDCGGVVIDDSYRIIQVLDGKQLGLLRMQKRHRVIQEYLSWHRRRWEQAQTEPNG